jgi:hypothetical protein
LALKQGIAIATVKFVIHGSGTVTVTGIFTAGSTGGTAPARALAAGSGTDQKTVTGSGTHTVSLQSILDSKNCVPSATVTVTTSPHGQTAAASAKQVDCRVAGTTNG